MPGAGPQRRLRRLAASLAPHVQVTSSGDSHLGFLALRKNLARNGLDLGSVRFVPASETAVGPFDHVLVKVPKTLALLEEQLIRLHGQLAPGAQVVAAGMAPAVRGKWGTRASVGLAPKNCGWLFGNQLRQRLSHVPALLDGRVQPVRASPAVSSRVQPALRCATTVSAISPC